MAVAQSQFVGCCNVGDVPSVRLSDPSLTAGDVVDLCGSPYHGTADLLRSRAPPVPVNGGALNLDGSPIDGSPVIGGGRHHVARSLANVRVRSSG